jgi:hypothetical protein
MTVVVRFNTKMFDVSRERPNPINPIAGESLLRWLKDRLSTTHQLTEPDAEDWGWYSHIEWDGTSYMLGSSASEPEDGEHEWVLQIVRSRSLKERLLGRGNATTSDPCVTHIVKLLSAEKGFTSVQVESEAL